MFFSMFPKSGRDGFVIWNSLLSGDLEQPIYSWMFSTQQRRSKYRTSRSEGFPVRRSGSIREQLTINGVDYVPPFIYYSDVSTIRQTLSIGWNDFANNERQMIECDLVWNNFIAEFNYVAGVSPAFQWVGNLSGVVNRKEFTTEPLAPFEDVIRCPGAICNRLITTTDTFLNSGEVHHVKKATIRGELTRKEYMTSRSNNRPVANSGVPDIFLTFDIEGDFDYWVDQVNDYEQINDYRIYYGDGINDFWPALNMKAEAVNNLIVDVTTGKMISATIELAAAYG